MALEVYETKGRIDYRKGSFDPPCNAVNGVFLIHPLEINNAKFVFSDPKMDRLIEMFAKTFREKGEVGDFVRAILRKNSLKIVGLIDARSGKARCQVALILIPFCHMTTMIRPKRG